MRNDDAPHIITHVETSPAPQADDDAIPHIHEALATHELLPQKHVVDTGYVDAKELVNSRQDYGVDLFGPTREDYHWQAQENSGFAASRFTINWRETCVTCPAGKTSSSWAPAKDRRGNPVIKIKFAVQDCRPCLSRAQCTQSQSDSPRRVLTVRPEPQSHALQAARERQTTTEFKTAYDRRAGIEGTLSPCAFVRLVYAKHAIKERPKSIYNTFSLRLLSILLGYLLGCQRCLAHKHDRLPSYDLLKKGLKWMGF